jgi:hypothetical protein
MYQKEEWKIKKRSIQQFAGILYDQLIQFASKMGSKNKNRFLPEEDEGYALTVPETSVASLPQC